MSEDDQHDSDDSGDDDIIHVAKTPTSDALLTQLKNNRIDSEIRGVGAGHTGSAIFHMQRLTALALIPLAVWFVIGIVRMTTGTHTQAAEWLGNPVHAMAVALFIVIALRHAVIGIQIVLEDYVHDDTLRRVGVLIVQALALVVGVASVAALIHLAL